MTLRDTAVAAFQASRSGLESDARAALAQAVTPADVSALTVASLEIDAAGRATFVFTDGDLWLAALQRPAGWEVHLVIDDGGWTDVGEVGSLATLGELAQRVPVTTPTTPPAYPEWVQPTGATDAYPLSARVTHNAKTWESLVAANVWEPGVAQWREVV